MSFRATASPKYLTATSAGTHALSARECLKALVAFVFSQRGKALQPITYEDLAFRIGRLNKHGKGHGHGLGAVLGVMGHLLEIVEAAWNEPIPHLQALVVNKAGPMKGLPDSGIKEFWPTYESMTRAEQWRHVRSAQLQVAGFDTRWNDVLAHLDLPRAPIPPRIGGRFGGGESKEHRALQQWVRDHPHIVGATAQQTADENYVLPSLDQIDLLFRSATECIGVEVKSRLSDAIPQDYERGLYQTIKYAAVLRAMHQAGAPESRPSVRTVLVLERSLPDCYRHTAKLLAIDVIENVTPLPL